jgi:hypothetical protein
MAIASASLGRAARESVSLDDPSSRPPPERRSPWCGLNRQVGLVLLFAAAIVLPRSYLIARAHSESTDDDFHLTRGLAFLTRNIAGSELYLNDPPLGEGLVAIPMLVTNLIEGRTVTDERLYDVPFRAETIAVRIALWNSALFLGFLGVVFTWCRSVYGVRSACFAVASFVVDPNFAGHVPIPALDVLGVAAIVIGTFLAWRYFERPTSGRMLALGFAVAFALMVKHTAVVLPLVIPVLAGIHWVLQPWLERQAWSAWKDALFARIRALALLPLIVPIFIWVLSLFDLSPPLTSRAVERQSLVNNGASVSRGKALSIALEKKLHWDAPWPAGCYLRAFRSGMGHGVAGHQSYLNGERSEQGWFNYFPVVASYKVPIGIGVILFLSVFTIRQLPPRWAEWGLFVPMLAWTLFMLNSKVNIGFRHFLPAYAFMIMLASRCVARSPRGWSAIACAAVAAAGLHALSYHPDYLCYMNAPWRKPYLAISDSNVDWGQALKQVRTWLDVHAQGEKKVSFSYFGNGQETVKFYLNDRVVPLDEHSARPTSGLLLISPVRLAGVYDDSDAYAALRDHEPDAVIGNSILVFDLDRLGRGSRFRWPALKGWPDRGSKHPDDLIVDEKSDSLDSRIDVHE